MRELIQDIIALNAKKTQSLQSLNGPNIGWISLYTPEEVVYAAGLVPFRITGESETGVSEASALLHHNMCSYVLSCLGEGIEGTHNSMDGIIVVDACNARRRLFDVWTHFLSPKYRYLLDLPKDIDPLSKQYFRSQVHRLAKSLEDHFQCEITGTALNKAINLSNESRRLLQQLYDLRKADTPCITASQAINIVKSSMSGFREEFNQKLALLLSTLELPKETEKAKNHRVLLCGSYFDHANIVNLIERFGAVVVCEDISNGIKYFEGQIETSANPLNAIADYYFDKATCSRMIDADRRFNHLLKLIEEYRAQSVIYFSLKFCDNNLLDFPYIRDRLLDNGIPVLFIEGEQHMSNIENIKTRIQTFLESRV